MELKKKKKTRRGEGIRNQELKGERKEESKKTEEPGGGKEVEVTMDVPGMQVSLKVDGSVSFLARFYYVEVCFLGLNE